MQLDLVRLAGVELLEEFVEIAGRQWDVIAVAAISFGGAVSSVSLL